MVEREPQRLQKSINVHGVRLPVMGGKVKALMQNQRK